MRIEVEKVSDLRVLRDGETAVWSKFTIAETLGAGATARLDVTVDEWGNPKCNRVEVTCDDGVSTQNLRSIPVAKALRLGMMKAAGFTAPQPRQEGDSPGIPSDLPTPFRGGPLTAAQRRKAAARYGKLRQARPNADGEKPRKRGRPLTDEHLQEVAAEYRRVIASDERAPMLYLADIYGVSRSTVDYWVRKARERGYLGPSPGPGKAGA